ncbi:MAG: branched-chain amino acid ABC transporter permease [Armatimonadota bacterium]|nr:branched-chain amino acid ABC transporter permease [Armatimonadota bacterium]MDR7427358.1 branched-chain amino acid ABC transporter permease [Armatimonadota bacterium]MDR7464876.1 branched-chain amino acid ABC transporter permease [Armatimonadota bacterium]MDR7474383.1 branched-chain amino acid ABC transporter permease [Armatimonadota bacterium]
MVIAVLIDGMVQGLQLGLLGVGITLVYGLGGVLNLAHGQLAVTTGVAAALLIGAGLHPAPAAMLGVLGAGLLGVVMDRTLLRPAYRRRGEERLLLALILTLGFAFVVDGFLAYRYPSVALTLRLPAPAVVLAGVRIRTVSLAVAGLGLAAFVLLGLFLRSTLLGSAVRSIMQNETGAVLCGIDVDRARTIVVGLSALLAGLAGLAQGLFSHVGPEMGPEFTVLALIVAVVGGVRSLTGTFVAGLLLGLVNAFSSFYVGTYLTWILLLLAALLTLLVRPEGLLAYWT